MKFHLVYPPTSSNGQSPVRVVEQTSGREVGWINRFLDREYVRRLADKTLRTYAHNLLHFVRWWESLHHTGDVVAGDLAESTLLDLKTPTLRHAAPARKESEVSVQPTTSAFRFHDQ